MLLPQQTCKTHKSAAESFTREKPALFESDYHSHKAMTTRNTFIADQSERKEAFESVIVIHSTKRNSEWMSTRQWFSLWQLTRLRFDQKHSARKNHTAFSGPSRIIRLDSSSLKGASQTLMHRSDASLVSQLTCLSALWSLSEYKS